MAVVKGTTLKFFVSEYGSLFYDNRLRSSICWQCFCSTLMAQYQFTPAMSTIYLAYISYNLSHNLSMHPLSFIWVIHPRAYPNINFSIWWQGFCASLWSVGQQRAARLEKIMALFGTKSSHRNSHHLFAPEISLIWRVGGARKLI